MSLPDPIPFARDHRGALLVLPIRTKRIPKAVALFPIIFGSIFIIVALTWIIGAFAPFPRAPAPDPGPEQVLPQAVPPPQPVPWTDYISRIFDVIFGIPFLAAGSVPFAIGIGMLLPNHAEILVTDSQLISVQVFGKFRWRVRRPLDSLKELRVDRSFASSKNQSPLDFTIFADFSEPAKKPLILAPGYPRDLLLQIASDLSRELASHNLQISINAPTPQPSAESAPEISPEEATPPPPTEADLPPQPADSKITFLPSSDSATFMIPRAGFRGAAGFFLIFSAFWLGITSIVSCGFLFAFIKDPQFAEILVFLFLSLFWAIGIAMLLAGIQTAYRRAVILATRDSLIITQQGPIRKSEFQWTPAEIAAIRVDFSGTTVNNRRLDDLQIHPATGRHRGFFNGRDPAELQWLAAQLRFFYALPTHAPSPT